MPVLPCFCFSPFLTAQSESVPEKVVYIIPVNEEISPFLTVYLKRSILKAEAENASCIIFELNTFGGRVDAALEITSLIGAVKLGSNGGLYSDG